MVETFARRLAAETAAKGGSTKYWLVGTNNVAVKITFLSQYKNISHVQTIGQTKSPNIEIPSCAMVKGYSDSGSARGEGAGTELTKSLLQASLLHEPLITN